MRSSPLRFLLLSIVLSMGQNITIYGPAIATSIFQDLGATFSLTRAEHVAYAVAPTNDVNPYLLAGNPVIVTKLDNVSNASLSIPMFGFPLVIIYNIRGTTVQLTQQLLVDILQGRVTRWNDPNMTLANPNITLPNQNITVVVGALLDLFVEGMSVITGQPFAITVATINVGTKVCAKVKANPYSLGLTWMGDALAMTAQLALLQNIDGFFASPRTGSPMALSEVHAASEASGGSVLPYNMRGSLTWPLMGMIYLVLPATFQSCTQLQTLQNFIASIMFRTANMDTFVQLVGWQPAKALTLLDQSLGVIDEQIDYRELLFALPCGDQDIVTQHTVGASSDMWSAMLKMLAAYASELDQTLLLSPSSNVTFLLNGMLPADQAVDMTFTWDYVITPYKQQLYSVPVLMSAVVPFINFDGAPLPTLSMSVLTDIFLGVISYWNDTRIQALNPDMVLPSQSITVLASRNVSVDGRTAVFAKLLADSNATFNWTNVNRSVTSSRDILSILEFTPYSIGYGFSTFIENVTAQVPKLIGYNNQPISLTSDSLAACWISPTHPNCWRMATPLSLAIRKPDSDTDCKYQKHTVDFAGWIIKRTEGVNPFLVPNLSPSHNLGPSEFCNGRSLLVTNPEPQALSLGAKYLVYVLCAIGIIWTICQACALAVARKRSELKSASVLFSLLAVVGALLILLAPILIVRDNPSTSNCGASVWLLVWGFSLCFGSIFAKLFRLYTIFTSRKLVVPRLSNRRLLIIVFLFLVIDGFLLLIYSILTPPEPYLVSATMLSSDDLVTGKRVFTLKTCSFHTESPVLWIILVTKFLVAFFGAVMAFSIRQVDKRFTSSSALGLAFYNLFLGCGIAVIIGVFFDSTDSLEFLVFTPVFCGLWVMYITIMGLTLDSNVLMACKDFSKPLRKLLGSKDSGSKDSKERDSKKSISDKAPADPNSKSGTHFVVNREMFPSQYDKFEGELLEQILEELNFQRTAVRHALVNSSTASVVISTGDTELTKDGHRLTMGRADSPQQPRRSETVNQSSPQRRSVNLQARADQVRQSENLSRADSPPPRLSDNLSRADSAPPRLSENLSRADSAPSESENNNLELAPLEPLERSNA